MKIPSNLDSRRRISPFIYFVDYRLRSLAPGKSVEFDDASKLIRFHIRDSFLVVNLAEPSVVTQFDLDQIGRVSFG